jgi:hypothetical protein
MRLARALSIALPLSLAGALPAFAQGAAAPAAPSPAAPANGCLAPIAEGAPDPAVRNVHLHVTTDPRYLAVTMCIASNEANGFQTVQASIGLIGSDGGLINTINSSYSNVAPLAGGAGNAPKLILPLSTAANIDQRYHDALAPQVLVTLLVVKCQEKLPACNAGPASTQVLTLPAEIDHDAPAAAPARR